MTPNPMTNDLPDPAAAPDSAPLYSPARVRALLAAHGLKPTKSLGQNFLIDGNILRAIAEAGGAAPGENVLEIGPGLGVLTREVASRGRGSRRWKKTSGCGPCWPRHWRDST